MAWHDENSWLTAAFAPKISTILISLVVAILLPILLHSWIYRKATPVNLPAILVVGPSGAGKTAFVTSTERATPVPTHTSTSPLTLETLLPSPYVPASAHFRSPGDPSFERARRFLFLDTPGHGKLRHFATQHLANPSNIRGIIFLVDAAAVAEDGGLNEAAEYLHDVLLALQKRYTGAKTSKGPKEIPVLVAANKLDLFTALPEQLVRRHLEKAIGEVRRTRAKGVREAGGVLDGGSELDGEEEREWLGEGGDGEFGFAQMEEVGVSVAVKGGSVNGGEGADARGFWEWIAELL